MLIHPYSPKLSTYSLQSLSKSQGIFHKTEIKKFYNLYQTVVVVQLPGCLSLCDFTDSNTPDFPVTYHLLEFAQVHANGIGDAIQPSHPLSPSFSSASIYPSIRVFYNQTAIHIRWPKYWSCSFGISPSHEYSG